MRSPGEIWRQRLWIWVPALLFFLANAGAFAVYKLGYAGRIESLQETLDTQAETVKKLSSDRKQMETMIARVQTNETQVEQLYTDRLSTRSQRLTKSNAEIKDLARQAGLVPKTINYPEEEIQEYNLIRRSSVFSVEGTYAGLRKFVSLLESSRSFLTLDEATVTNNAEGPELRIDLTLSTLFARDAQDEPLPAPEMPAPTTSAPTAPGAPKRGTR
jgi:Tfp pilus assembly protein PilO